MSSKKAIVFFSAGIGDAVLLIPAIKRLKSRGYEVSGLFNSTTPCAEVMLNTGLLSESIDVKGKTQQALFALKKIKRYDLAVLNYFACSRKNLLTAKTIASQVIANGRIENDKSVKYIRTIPGIHDAEQNLRLIDETGFDLSELSISPLPRPEFNLPENFIALQVSSGDPAIAYKNWPIDNWKKFLAQLFAKFPDKSVVLLGNNNDAFAGKQLEKQFGNKIRSVAGKTSITQAMQVLSNCEMFIGLDGGLTHLAVAFGKPTFTLWGPSSEKLYGYQQFDPQMHACVRLLVNCFPCNAWIEPNTSKTNDPVHCPDHACLALLDANDVFHRFEKYSASLPAHVR